MSISLKNLRSSANILEFLGVEWNENVKLQKNSLRRSNINTPSYSQIIQPLNNSSREMEN